MNLKSLMSSKELNHSLWAVVILTLVFGFNDGNEFFIFSDWIYHLLLVFILVAITVLATIIGAKTAARYLGEDAELRILGVKGINFNIFSAHVEGKFNWNILGFKIKYIPLSPILAFILMLISRGTIFFTSIFTIVIKKSSNFGKSMNENREALIYFWALIANMILIVVFDFLGIGFGVLINTYFIFWNLWPIPGFLGSKIFFNNKMLYVFFFIFSIIFLIFVGNINIILLLVFASLIAFLTMILWIFKKEYKG